MAYSILDFGFLLHRAAYILDQQTRSVLSEEENLPLPLFLILDLLESGRITTQWALAELLVISKSAVSKQLDILEDQKFVTRTTSDKNHKNIIVVVTEAGKKKVRHARATLAKSGQSIEATFGEELQDFTAQLDKLCKLLDPEDRVY